MSRRIPLRYNLRSVIRRRLAFAMTTAGVAVVVAIFVAMLALATGLRDMLAVTAEPDHAVIMLRGVLAEGMSEIKRDSFAIVRELPEIRRDGGGRPLASPEAVIVWLAHAPDGGSQQVAMRGVTDIAYEVHRKVRVIEGRRPQPGQGEAMVGRALAGRIEGLSIGQSFRWGRRSWKTVGIFEAQGSAFESEVWGDLDGVLADDHRTEYSSATVVLSDPAALGSLGGRLDADRRFALRAQPEADYYRTQAGSAEPLVASALVVAVLMGIAAVFGALNTMHASLAGRRREVAILRALGFGRRAIAASFVLESALQTLPAGVLGCLLASMLHGYRTSMLSLTAFNSMTFSLRVTPEVAAAGLIFSVLIGLLGGTWPAYSASRRSIVAGLRG